MLLADYEAGLSFFGKGPKKKVYKRGNGLLVILENLEQGMGFT